MEEQITSTLPVETLRKVFDRQQRAYRRYAPLGYSKRIEALETLLQSIFNHEEQFTDAVMADFGQRPASETRLLEIFPLVDEIRHVKRNLRRWMKPRAVPVNWQFFPSRAKVLYQPLGVAGVIGAWNYPVLLTLSPLVSALSAGNHVMIKPSELAPATAEVIRKIISNIFPEEYVSVATGGKEVAAAFAALPFDHLLYTGSDRVGRLVMKAAAENLTPVTLELGGKSPALIHESYPMATAAERICSAKFWNAGQTCISPDYALVPKPRVQEFVHHAQDIISRRYPRPASNNDYTHMITAAAWQRMQELVDDAAAKGAQVIKPDLTIETFTAENRIFPPALVLNASDSMRLMQEEIFGPVLPVVSYSSLEEALEFINARPRPLAFYYFDRNSSRIEDVLSRTVSGGVTVNDCIFHFPQHGLPFGGVGSSGMGAYHGFDGFATFSKKKGMLFQNGLTGSFLARGLKPPYSRRSDRIIALLLRRTRPRPVRKFTLTGNDGPSI
jgi:coniferyl-aldehyde dehydrogenase